MTNIAQQNLHFELSDRNNKDCFKTVISKDFTPYSKHLNSLKNSFEEEVERNLQEFNNYPLAYKYIKEVFYDFEMLRKYYFNSIFTHHSLKGCCKKSLNFINEKTKEIVRFLKNMNSMICDFLALKSDLLIQLKDDYFKNIAIQSSTTKWAKNAIDIIEVSKLLKDTGIVKGVNGKLTLKDIVNDLSTLFGFPVKDIYSKVSKAKDRKVLKKPVIYQIIEDYIVDV